jgi:antitoxin component YwqK of YwqJK toxin-antitoxin module
LNKTSYQESVRNGKYEAYSSKDFKLTEEGTFKNGKKHGLWIAYHPGGRLPAVTSDYKDGKLHGFVREYDFKAGKLLRSETQYKDGVKHGKMTIYDKRGKKVAEKFFDNGIEVKQNDFTPPPPRKKKKK